MSAAATKSAYVAEMRRRLADKYDWAREADRLDRFMEKVATTLAPGRQTPVDLLHGPTGLECWRAISGKGKLTYKALKALPE